MIHLTYGELLHVARRAVAPDVVVRDAGLLESALARPRASVLGADAYPTLEEKAAALVHSLVNNHGLVVGSRWLAGPPVSLDDHAYRHDLATGTTTDLGTLGGVAAAANAVNDDGTIVGWSQLANGQRRAFVHQAGSGMTDLGTLQPAATVPTSTPPRRPGGPTPPACRTCWAIPPSRGSPTTGSSALRRSATRWRGSTGSTSSSTGGTSPGRPGLTSG